jgi:hypothetical protein
MKAPTLADGRAALREWGIEDAKLNGELAKFARDCLREGRDAVEEDPDAGQDDATERADALVPHDALDVVRESGVLLRHDPGFGDGTEGIEDRARMILYDLGNYLIGQEIERCRPALLDFEHANPRPGYVTVGRTEDEGFVHIKVELRQRDGYEELSIVGSVRDGGGQIDMHLSPDAIEPAPGWTYDDLKRLWSIWSRWHLNGMNAHCEHQRVIADKLGKKPSEVFTIRNEHVDEHGRYNGNYGRGVDGKQASNARVQCPICSYDYGSAWRREPLPEDVREWLIARFPNATKD